MLTGRYRVCCRQHPSGWEQGKRERRRARGTRERETERVAEGARHVPACLWPCSLTVDRGVFIRSLSQPSDAELGRDPLGCHLCFWPQKCAFCVYLCVCGGERDTRKEQGSNPQNFTGAEKPRDEKSWVYAVDRACMYAGEETQRSSRLGSLAGCVRYPSSRREN